MVIVILLARSGNRLETLIYNNFTPVQNLSKYGSNMHNSTMFIIPIDASQKFPFGLPKIRIRQRKITFGNHNAVHDTVTNCSID